MHHSSPPSVTHSCGLPGITTPLQLLRTNDVGISRVQAEQPLHLALACAGRPALSGDLSLWHPVSLLWFGRYGSLLSRVAPERPGVVVASTRISARQPAILEYRLAGTPTCARGHASEAAATPGAKSRDAQPYPEVAPDNRPDSPTGTLDESTGPQAGKEVNIGPQGGQHHHCCRSGGHQLPAARP